MLLTGSTFCNFELIETTVPGYSIKRSFKQVGSYFKFILFLSGGIKLNPGLIISTRNDMPWELLPLYTCSSSAEQMDYQIDFLPDICNDA